MQLHNTHTWETTHTHVSTTAMSVHMLPWGDAMFAVTLPALAPFSLKKVVVRHPAWHGYGGPRGSVHALQYSAFTESSYAAFCCPALIAFAECNSQPQAVPNGNSFSCSLPANAGATCTGTCAVGYTGSQTASCSSNGAWTVSGSCTSSTGSSDTAAGINKDQFTKVFAGDTDKCGSACPGYSSNPNTQTVIDKHWGFFKSAAAARGFRLQVCCH